MKYKVNMIYKKVDYMAFIGCLENGKIQAGYFIKTKAAGQIRQADAIVTAL